MSTHNGPTLEVSLAAIARNYDRIKSRLVNTKAGAVVKANAYGLGMTPIAPTLYDAGCRDFFVATPDEAMELRAALDRDIEPRVILPEAKIYVFQGLRAGQTKDFLAHRLTPVLNSLEQIKIWDEAGPYALHVDTGMCRLGISSAEAEALGKSGQGHLNKLSLIMSHLACASDPDHPKNKEQLELFKKALQYFPGKPASFANSSGIELGPEYHFDLARPGRALYGITRGVSAAGSMENVVRLSAPVIQYRLTDQPETVGYGGTAQVEKGTLLGTFELGYADGFLRALSHKMHGYVAGIRVPILGLVSMDMIIADVTDVPEHLRGPDLRITLIGEEHPIDIVAEAAGTIGYEIFTRLGRRVKRVYKD